MIFEPGTEYWLTWGTTDEQILSSIKVIGQDGTWLHIESEKEGLDPMINLAAPIFISARKRNRETEKGFVSRISFVDHAGREGGHMDIGSEGK
ncbi:hypothetical protein [Sphingobium ummariense]|uniref:Uncharacterized protein n=1 Tax=Sphingobium ummariense RL-3 TaxID=1346791 RepID=T0K6E8_9SPHN|nr:hypothetical protein [Sphingobium ummariense]EQB32249.1 hypothetical protein M529_10630 [Sphingobium ummariense RL-3]